MYQEREQHRQQYEASLARAQETAVEMKLEPDAPALEKAPEKEVKPEKYHKKTQDKGRGLEL